MGCRVSKRLKQQKSSPPLSVCEISKKTTTIDWEEEKAWARGQLAEWIEERLDSSTTMTSLSMDLAAGDVYVETKENFLRKIIAERERRKQIGNGEEDRTVAEQPAQMPTVSYEI